jgi:hypothetical protein
MADDALKFNRFTALPSNIAEYGATKEEFDIQKGAPDPDPVHSPMPEARITETRLALVPSGSDMTRVSRPAEPNFNAFEGPRKLVILSRQAVHKLDSPVVEQLMPAIEASNDQNLANMKQSLRCAFGMREQSRTLTTWAEQVEYKSLSVSRG